MFAAAFQGKLRRRWLAVALVCASSPLFAITPEDVNYLKGYIDALLDLKFPAQDITVLQVVPESRETVLGAQGCLSAAQRGEIERALQKTERVASVRWEGVVDCPAEPAVAVAPAPVPEPAPAPSATKEKRVEVEPLPSEELFKPLVADPRQPQFAIRYHYYDTPVDTFNAGSVSFGGYFGFASGFLGDKGVSQIGVQGAVFSLFNLDAASSDLVNSDFWIGLPVSYRRGRWSFLGRIYHQSSHLGDEFLLGQPDINRINLSYEDFEMLASYDWKRWRFYGGGGYIVHSEPDLEPWHLQAGIEYVQPKMFRWLDFIAAVDWQADEEVDWHRNRSYQAGFSYTRKNREIRLMAEHYRGFSPNGQFYREPLRYTGLGLYFHF